MDGVQLASREQPGAGAGPQPASGASTYSNMNYSAASPTGSPTAGNSSVQLGSLAGAASPRTTGPVAREVPARAPGSWAASPGSAHNSQPSTPTDPVPISNGGSTNGNPRHQHGSSLGRVDELSAREVRSAGVHRSAPAAQQGGHGVSNAERSQSFHHVDPVDGSHLDHEHSQGSDRADQAAPIGLMDPNGKPDVDSMRNVAGRAGNGVAHPEKNRSTASTGSRGNSPIPSPIASQQRSIASKGSLAGAARGGSQVGNDDGYGSGDGEGDLDDGPGHQTSPPPQHASQEHDFYVASSGASKIRRKKESLWSRIACPASCGGYNFVKVFVILSGVQVIITVVLCWLIGYLGLVSAASQLSDQVRTAVMVGVLESVNTELSTPITAAQNVHYMTQNRFPDINDADDVTDRDGFIADLLQLGLQFPNVARIGYLNHNEVYAHIQKNASSALFTSQQGMIVSLRNSTDNSLRSYVPTPIPSRNRNTNMPPLALHPEIRSTDSSRFIRHYLGQPRYEEYFTVQSLKFYPTILAQVASSTAWAMDPTVPSLGTAWSPPFTALDRITYNGSENFLCLACFVSSVNNNTGEFAFAGFTLYKLTTLESVLAGLPFGDHGIVHLVRAGGDILASSQDFVQEYIQTNQKLYHLSSSPDSLIQAVSSRLRKWGLVTDDGVVSNVTVTNVAYNPTLFSTSFTTEGYGWRLEAQMLDPLRSALPYTVVLLTRDDDFDGGVTQTIKYTGIAAGVICITACFLTFMITKCITRPLLGVVDYMGRAVKVISMDRGVEQREALTELCEAWSGESGMLMPPLLPSAQPHHSLAQKMDVFATTPLYASFCWLCNEQGDTCCCYRVGRSLREVQMMHAAFGSMLYTLASYDELEAINQAKRQFIRYIFHEVRVPFNAIVMGIEQMQLELAPHQALVGNTLETLDILREQSAVVSRILNDVLSMQKIEDGALALEYDNFSLEKMIRGALYAFRTPCLEKRLKVRVNLQNLDELVNDSLPGLRLGKVRMRAPDGTEIVGNAPPNRHHGRFSNTIGSEGSLNAIAQEVYHANVRGDPYRLRQCLANFTSNAIKFTPIGGLVRVSLDLSRFEVNPLAQIASDQLLIGMGMDPKHKSASRASHTLPSAAGQHQSWHQAPVGPIDVAATASSPLLSPGGTTGGDNPMTPVVPELLGTVMVKCTVKDSGPGIPLDHQPHIFEAYMQVQAGKIQKGNGTGLGLNITKNIVELHGGQISYTSVPGEGAEFSFTLPMDVFLVRSGSKDSSSYGAYSSTAARSHLSLRADSDKKLSTIAGSPDLHVRELDKVVIDNMNGGTSNMASMPTTPLAPLAEESANRNSTKSTSSAKSTVSKSKAGAVGSVSNKSTGTTNSSSKNNGPVNNSNTSVMNTNAALLAAAVASPSGPSGIGGVVMVHTGGSTTASGSVSGNSSGPPSSGSTPPAPMSTSAGSNSASAAVAPLGLGLATPSLAQPVNEDDIAPRFHDENSNGAVGTTEEQRPLMSTSATPPPASSSSPPTGATATTLKSALRSSTGKPPVPPVIVNNPLTSPGSGASPKASNGSPGHGYHTVTSNNGTVSSVSASSANDSPPVSQERDRHTSFYGHGHSGNSRSRSSRGLRGPRLGVAISSSTGSHSAAQNLTASVKPPTSAGNSATPVLSGGSGGGLAAPAASSTGTRQALPSSAVPGGAAGPNPLAGARVLVVEDSPPNRKLLMSLLNHMGCTSQGVENGQECVDLFKDYMTSSPSSKTQHGVFNPLNAISPAPTHGHLPSQLSGSGVVPSAPIGTAHQVHMLAHANNPQALMPRYPFDVILMDGSMPVMNGVEATQILRQHGVLVPIIAITGNALAEDVAAFMTAGCNHVLTKPIARKKLSDTLALYLHQPTF